jgi:hypothetical protein
MHHYNNQDHSMMTALIAARNIATIAGLDPWKVNTDAEYHEELTFDESDKSGRLVTQRILSGREVTAIQKQERCVAAGGLRKVLNGHAS